MFIMLYQDSSNGHTNFKWRVNTIIQYLVIDKFNSDLSLVLSIYHSKCKHGSFSYVYITKKNVNLILYLTIYSRISVDHLKYFNKPINKNIAVHHLSYFYKVINNKEGKKQFENADWLCPFSKILLVRSVHCEALIVYTCLLVCCTNI